MPTISLIVPASRTEKYRRAPVRTQSRITALALPLQTHWRHIEAHWGKNTLESIKTHSNTLNLTAHWGLRRLLQCAPNVPYSQCA